MAEVCAAILINIAGLHSNAVLFCGAAKALVVAKASKPPHSSVAAQAVMIANRNLMIRPPTATRCNCIALVAWRRHVDLSQQTQKGSKA